MYQYSTISCHTMYIHEPLAEMDQKLDVDEIWRALRPWGRYQLRQLAMMWLAMIPSVIHLMISVFIGMGHFKQLFKCFIMFHMFYNVSYCIIAKVYHQFRRISEPTNAMNLLYLDLHELGKLVTQLLCSGLGLLFFAVPVIPYPVPRLYIPT